MGRYEAALRQVRALVLARNAIEDVLREALRELEAAAAAEGHPTVSVETPSPRVVTIASEAKSGLHPKARIK